MNLSEDKKIEDLLIDGFKIIQSENLYRFTSDAVLLARFPTVYAKNVLDICAGSGIVGLHYYATARPESVTFVEVQKALADMCEQSVELNGLSDKLTVCNMNLKDYDGKGAFDLVFCNPPYYKEGSGCLPGNEHIAICRKEVLCNLDDIVKCAARALKYGGRFCICHKPERLADIFICLNNHGMSPSRLRFIKGNGNNEIYLVLVEGVKGKKPQLKVEGIFENNATDFKG